MQTMCSQMKKITNEKELFEKWKESFAFRRNQLQTGYFSNWKLYFDEYPFCKQQNYTEYVSNPFLKRNMLKKAVNSDHMITYTILIVVVASYLSKIDYLDIAIKDL